MTRKSSDATMCDFQGQRCVSAQSFVAVLAWGPCLRCALLLQWLSCSPTPPKWSAHCSEARAALQFCSRPRPLRAVDEGGPSRPWRSMFSSRRVVPDQRSVGVSIPRQKLNHNNSLPSVTLFYPREQLRNCMTYVLVLAGQQSQENKGNITRGSMEDGRVI
jgi:hypothetical protein